jgi:hypothetical protein
MMFRMVRLQLMLVFLTGIGMAACSVKHTTSNVAVREDKIQIAEFSKDWLQYKVYQMNDVNKKRTSKKEQTLKLCVRIINMRDNVSPLRSLCSNLDEYNSYYEHLLNGAKNELFLLTGNQISFPVYYSFENNYNTFPFETINVGYALPKASKKSNKTTLVFVDRIFSKDSIFFNLNNNSIQ